MPPRAQPAPSARPVAAGAAPRPHGTSGAACRMDRGPASSPRAGRTPAAPPDAASRRARRRPPRRLPRRAPPAAAQTPRRPSPRPPPRPYPTAHRSCAVRFIHCSSTPQRALPSRPPTPLRTFGRPARAPRHGVQCEGYARSRRKPAPRIPVLRSRPRCAGRDPEPQRRAIGMVMTERPTADFVATFANAPLTDFSNPENVSKQEAALRQVASEFGTTFPLIIGGERRTTAETFDSINPARPEQVVARFAKATAKDADDAVQA